MKSMKGGLLPAVSGLLMLTALFAQDSPRRSAHHEGDKPQSQIPAAFRGFRIPPSGPLAFLASEEGRSFLVATGHPVAKYAIARFGEPAQTTVVPERWLRMNRADSAAGTASAGTVPCSGSAGARFNLEPRTSAVPQNQGAADFLPNRIGPNDDLIVQAANDWRGNLTNVNWDQSVSGYYVHRSTTADCSVQFEGGLPSFTFQGNTEMGTGNTVVAADPARDAIFMADVRFAGTGGVGLFRASASSLLSSATCPNGTHTLAQATSCWTVIPPVLLFPAPSFDSVGDQPHIVVDERATGTGAGDVYVVSSTFNFSTQTNSISVAACSDTLSCAQPVAVSGSNSASGFPYIQLRTDGTITVSFINSNSDGTATVFFATCTPSGAPKAPVCHAPVQVAKLSEPLFPSISVANPLVNVNLQVFTYPKHANRTESGGKFTSFVVYEDCKNPYQFGNPPVTICLDAEVMMTTSADGGNTWSAPISVDASAGHHFYPAITTDTSTGIVNLAYYSTSGDKFNHDVRVFRNQIAPGGTSVGTPQRVTTILDPIDADPQDLGYFQSDAYLSAIARGNGATGQSRLYTSFDSTTVFGSYEGRFSPEQNNHISLFSY